MKKYEVDFYSYETRATSAIDTVETEGEYTAEQYILDCEHNADLDWLDMLHSGEVTVVEVE